MKYLILIALGGAGGAVSRHLLGSWAHDLWDTRFPIGTLLVNVIGSFAIGVLFVVIMERAWLHPDWRGVLMVGFLGAFTTFSTFSLDTIQMIESGAYWHAAGYIVASFLTCVLAAGLAIYLARALLL
ncbi:MAG: fluoride efflux transporter CrcB [Pseudomonadota bacterium]